MVMKWVEWLMNAKGRRVVRTTFGDYECSIRGLPPQICKLIRVFVELDDEPAENEGER